MKSLVQYIKESLYENFGYPILEMAQINNEDDSTSEFPWNRFKIYIYSDDHNPAHIHIMDRQEKWDIRVDILTGDLISVKKYGKRNRKNTFSDIIKLAKSWLSKNSQAEEFKNKTNRKMAIYNWNANNPDRKVILE